MNKDFEKRLNAAKEVDMADMLARLNIHPAGHQNPNARTLYYHSPLREGEDKNPSFIVHRDNPDACWIDMAGYHENGDTVNFIEKYMHCSCREAVEWILSNCGAFLNDMPSSIYYSPASTADNGYSMQEIVSIGNITSEKLTAYLSSRNISVETANKYCREIIYKYKDMQFHAIGFKNDSGGYAIRSYPTKNNPKGFKGVLKSNDISTIRVGNGRTKNTLMFEGFFNLLSFVEIYGNPLDDVIVLNGMSNAEKIPQLSTEGVKTIDFYRDNDVAGMKAFKIVSERTGCVMKDCSGIYASHGQNDLSEHLAFLKENNKYKSNMNNNEPAVSIDEFDDLPEEDLPEPWEI